MKKSICILLAVAVLLAALPGICFGAEIVASGTCGAEGDGGNLTWTLDGDGTLTIGGAGEMKDYERTKGLMRYPLTPWNLYLNRIRSVRVEEGVTGVGNCAFNDCTELTDATLPDSVTRIGEYAFMNCPALAHVTIGNGVKSIDSGAFYLCGNLDGVYIHDLKAWFDISFSGSYNNPLHAAPHLYLNGVEVRELTVPAGVTQIGQYAFYGWSRLTKLRIPDGVTQIGRYAFAGCRELTSLTLPDSLTGIDAYAFSDCTGLTAVPIPGSVAEIGRSAFSGCTGLTRLDVPTGLTKIGASAFSGCTGLLSVSLPDSLTTIEKSAFQTCSGVETLTLGGVPEYPYADFTNLKELVLTDRVTAIPASAFTGCKTLAGVMLGKNVTEIGKDAFSGCTGLLTYRVAEENEAFSSADGILYNKEGTALLAYPAAKTGSAFSFPEAVVSIADGAFADNRNLKEIRIPDRITGMGRGCFVRSLNLYTAVYEGAPVLPEDTFADCKGLTAAYLPSGTGRIGVRAFSGCGALRQLLLSADLETIGANAFSGCGNLDVVFYTGTSEAWTAIGVKTGNEALTGARKVFRADEDGLIPEPLPADPSDDGDPGFLPAKGDVDENGRVDAADARLTLRAAVGLDPIRTGTDRYRAADADRSGALEAADARLILRRVVGLTDPEYFA